jgi:hypothetical protein
MPLTARGYDCSWAPPDQQCMKNAGYAFLVRYGSRDPSKNLTKAELDSALAKGLSVCVVWQEGKTQMTRGNSGGQTDARDADSFVKGLGLAGIPLYFACDYDPPSSDWAKIDAYLDGVASVIGRNRTGGYGGKAFISREFGNGKITWGWQTYAWSGSPTQWDSRAQLRQVKNDFARCGGTIDDDEAWAADFGQWPRPGSTPQPQEDEGMFAVIIPPGAGTADSPDIGVSLDKTTYTRIGFCCDPGRLGSVPVKVRVAWHWTDNSGWGVGTVTMTAAAPKAVLSMSGKVDGVSFRRQDNVAIDLYPNFA